jgi:large subunit ribosomal protein L17
MLSNMASSLILHKRITTTVAKAKALRKYVEPLLTKSKSDTTNSRRVVFSYLQNKESVKELFDVVSEKISQRPGGYTRIIRMGNRLGDNAETCMMELVDYNELLLDDDSSKAKTRRSRRGGKKSTDGEKATTAKQADDSKAAKKEEKTEAKKDQPKEEETDTEVKAQTESEESTSQEEQKEVDESSDTSGKEEKKTSEEDEEKDK